MLSSQVIVVRRDLVRRLADMLPWLEWHGYDELCAEQPAGRLPAQVEEVGFMIEELRVQYFAQRLRTHIPVSPKRIRQAIGQVRSQS